MLLSGCSVCVCVSEWLPVCLCLCEFSWLPFNFTRCLAARSRSLCARPPPPCGTIKFQMATFDCQLRLLTNTIRIVAMTCGLVGDVERARECERAKSRRLKQRARSALGLIRLKAVSRCFCSKLALRMATSELNLTDL